MAITKNSMSPVNGFGFAVNATSADASSCEELVATPGVGKSIHIQQLEISCVATLNVTIGQGESSNNVETVLFGPFYFTQSSGSPVNVRLNKPVKLTANKSLTVDASASGNIQVFVEGYVDE